MTVAAIAAEVVATAKGVVATVVAAIAAMEAGTIAAAEWDCTAPGRGDMSAAAPDLAGDW